MAVISRADIDRLLFIAEFPNSEKATKYLNELGESCRGIGRAILGIDSATEDEKIAAATIIRLLEENREWEKVQRAQGRTR